MTPDKLIITIYDLVRDISNDQTLGEMVRELILKQKLGQTEQ